MGYIDDATAKVYEGICEYEGTIRAMDIFTGHGLIFLECSMISSSKKTCEIRRKRRARIEALPSG
ncbi:MAG: hypothetical protein A4E65_00508 [Syntrophorhabdus sp. PtaU1.Bin153]|nr:MAG: hypothetical protein A4E65_00508 [Syntrophorhabdus sp. PtaU1.Bin153]